MFKKNITLTLILSSAFGFFAAKGTENTENHVFYALPLGATKAESTSGESIQKCWDSYANFRISDAPEDHDLSSDLGQQTCMKVFGDSYQTYRDEKAKYILAGTSQGTATILNWLGQKSHEEQKKDTSALFLESVLGSANNTLVYFVENMPNHQDWSEVKQYINESILEFIKDNPRIPQVIARRAESTSSVLSSSLSFAVRSGTQLLSALTYLPFARTWVPYAAKVVAFPTYNPREIQAIDSVSNLSPDIPVIIIHHKEDKKICIDDARRVYCKLLDARKGNAEQNVYLFEIENTTEYTCSDFSNHDAILVGEGSAEKTVNIIQSIFKKHNIGIMRSNRDIADLSEADLKRYQPSIAEVKQRIANNSVQKKNSFIRNVIDSTTGMALTAGISYLAKNYLTQMYFETVAS